MDIRNGLKVGDEVTSPYWDGQVCTIKEFADGEESAAIFTDGGFWRTSQLIRAQPPRDREDAK